MEKLRESKRTADYPPSVLVVADRNRKVSKLKRWLEDNGCEVYGTGATPIDLEGLDQAYFELVVLDIEEPDSSRPTTGRKLRSIYKKLQSEPEFLNLPVVMLTNRPPAEGKGAMHSLLCCLPKNRAARRQLLQIIQQTHYLASRYT